MSEANGMARDISWLWTRVPRGVRPGLALPLALLAVCVVFTSISPIFLSPDNLVSIVHQVTITGIMALGMTFVVMTGGIDLSIGPVLAIAGVAAAETLVTTDGSVTLAVGDTVTVRGHRNTDPKRFEIKTVRVIAAGKNYDVDPARIK